MKIDIELLCAGFFFGNHNTKKCFDLKKRGEDRSNALFLDALSFSKSGEWRGGGRDAKIRKK